MPLIASRENSTARGTIAAVTMLNVALGPLYANMIVIASSSWEFGRIHSFQLALLAILALVSAQRWRLQVGILLNIVVAFAAIILLFWSAEPLAYLAYTAFLLAAGVALYAFIYILTRRKRNGRTGK